MPTLPTILLPKGANTPAGWPYDTFTDWLDPSPTSYASGVMVGGVLQSAVVITLTSAQLLALNATPIQLLNAPPVPPKGFGSATVLVPEVMYLQYIFGGTAYTLGNADNRFQVEYTGKAVNLISSLATGLVDQAANSVNYVQPINPMNTAGALTQANTASLGLEVKLAGTTPGLTLGNGTVTLTLLYYVFVLQ